MSSAKLTYAICDVTKEPNNQTIYHAFYIYCAAEVFFWLFTYSFLNCYWFSCSGVAYCGRCLVVYFRILQACKWFVGTTDTVVRMHIHAAQEAVISKVPTSLLICVVYFLGNTYINISKDLNHKVFKLNCKSTCKNHNRSGDKVMS